jgi:hypothetical protein
MAQESTTESRSLEAEGWVRQFTVDVQRVDEYVELYQSLGDEVWVETMSPELVEKDECATCLLAECDKYVVIYTRQQEETVD